MNPDTLSSYTTKSIEHSPYEALGANAAHSHFGHLPKDVLEVLERGDIEQALAMLRGPQQVEKNIGDFFLFRIANALMNAMFLPFQLISRLGNMNLPKTQKVQKQKINASQIIAFIKTSLHGLGYGIGKLLIHFPSKIYQSIAFSINAVKNITSHLMGIILAISKTVTQWSRRTVESLKPMLQPFISIYHMLNALGRWTREKGEKFLEKSKDKLNQIKNAIQEFLRPYLQAVKEDLETVQKQCKEFAEHLVQKVGEITQTSIQYAATATQPVVNLLVSFIAPKWREVHLSFQNFARNLKEAGKWFQKKASAGFRAVANTLTASLSFTYRLLNYLLQKISSFLHRWILSIWLVFSKIIYCLSSILIQLARAFWFFGCLIFLGIGKKVLRLAYRKR